MKNMKKLTAAVLSAATMLGGLAFGTSIANAEESATDDKPQCVATVGGTTITINAEDINQLLKSDGTPREFKFVRIANYLKDDNGNYTGLQADNTKKVLGDEKAEGSNFIRGLSAWYIAAWTLYENSEEGGWAHGYEYSSADGAKDPMQWVAENLLSGDDGGVRKFVDAIDNGGTNDTDASGNEFKPIKTYILNGGKINDPSPQPTGKLTDNYDGSGKLTFNLGEGGQGMYLIYDVSGEQTIGGEKYEASKTILVGTPLNQATDGSCKAIENANGTVNVKNQPSTTDKPKGTFQFTKVDAEGKELAGAGFVISKTMADGTTKYGRIDNGAWVFDKDSATAEGVTVRTSGTDGIVSFPFLTSGDYHVEEITVPDGFLQEVKPAFDVTVTITDTGEGTSITYEAEGTGKYKDLVLGKDNMHNDGRFDAQLKVKNVKNKTQLPLTGSTGIALFAALAVVLGGAAIAFALRGRGLKRALR